MPSNIATGIGLSGQLQADNSGQLNRLAAEKAAAGERQAKQAAEAKERDELEKEVQKNLLVNSGLKTSFYQRDFSNRSKSVMADVISGLRTGEMSRAEIYGKLQEFKNYTDQVKSADAGLYGSLEKVTKEPEKFAWKGERTFGGKPVNSIFEALQDPYSNTPEGMKELQNQFWGSEYQFHQPTPEEVAMGAPTSGLVGYNPIELADPLDRSLEFAKNKNLYTDLKEGKAEFFDPRTRTLMKEVGYGMNDYSIGAVRNSVLQDASVLRNYEAQLENEFRKANPNATYQDFANSGWQTAAQAMYDNDVVPSLRNSLDGKRLMTSQIDKPTEAKESDSKKNAEKHLVGGARSADGKSFEIKIPGRDQVARKFEIPKGATFYTGAEGAAKKKSTVDAPATIDAQPYKISWGETLGDSKILYQSKLKPTGEEGEDKEVYTYEIPVTRQSMNDLAGNFAVNYTDFASRIIELSETGPTEDIKKWLDTLGMSSDGTGGGSGTESNTKTTPADFNTKWAALKSGESLVGPDGKTYTKK